MKIRKGDKILVITGKDKGRESTVVRVLPKESKVVIDGVNIKKKTERSKKKAGKGQIIDKALPIHISNVMLIDPKSKKRTRAGFEIKAGKKTRIARKSGSAI
jgi:large subunit ribosomal protein L24